MCSPDSTRSEELFTSANETQLPAGGMELSLSTALCWWLREKAEKSPSAQVLGALSVSPELRQHIVLQSGPPVNVAIQMA